jgi:DNA-binding transcriptional LysR family regulator
MWWTTTGFVGRGASCDQWKAISASEHEAVEGVEFTAAVFLRQRDADPAALRQLAAEFCIEGQPGTPAISGATRTRTLDPARTQQHGMLELALAESRLASPESIVETAAILVTTTLIQHTNMVAVVPTSVANLYAGKHLISILPVRLPRRLDPYGLVTRRRESLSAAGLVFVNALRKESDLVRTG